MKVTELYTAEELTTKAKAYFAEERAKKRLDGWFFIREIIMQHQAEVETLPKEEQAAELLKAVVRQLPLTISEHAVFAGTQDDAFARSYALINPAFTVESFSGYCDPTAVFGDIKPNAEITQERIEAVRRYNEDSDYVRALGKVYDSVQDCTGEVAFFIEQVTGHVIPDFRRALSEGVNSLIAEAAQRMETEPNEKHKSNFRAMKTALECVVLLAQRYRALAEQQRETADARRARELDLMIEALSRVPAQGARNLYEAIQAFLLLWQVMCAEQSPNPFAFSVGNADRIFEPYRAADGLEREMSAALFKHFLVFYNVADRSWAISQNILISGKSSGGSDLTNLMSYAILDAYYDMNLPQPILSVKLHKNTPDELYQEMGRFFFTPGCLTPSLFNDDALFPTLARAGVVQEDLENYAVAGCQEPLIMGKDNGNTTNSWLNLAKILELTLSEGVSTVTGNQIGSVCPPCDAKTRLENIRELFYQNVAHYTRRMVEAANGATHAISLLPVPFLSAFMGGLQSGVDMRDTTEQGTPYNGSGCLIHGLSVVADSFAAIDALLEQRPQDAQRLIDALKNNFAQDGELHTFLLSCPKFGNNIPAVDEEAADIVNRVSNLVRSCKNNWGNPFRPDWSSPSTHLLYGYWVGATPDGRKSRDMLGYGVDPLYGEANSGMGFRMLSNMKLPFAQMNGGYASHFGIDPGYFTAPDFAGKGMDFKARVLSPLFFNDRTQGTAPFYLYVNVTTPDTLRKVLENPKKYAPSGVYIMRIHGTFVNFLDLSPAIQKDIITRLDLQSTAV